MKQVIGIGNALVDALYRMDDDRMLDELALPKGSMQLIDTERYHGICHRMAGAGGELATGGSAGNTILALANLGARPALIGKIADDENGRLFEGNCRERGITPRLLRDTLPTGVASTFISSDGQRTFATYLGAAARLVAGDVRPEWLEGYSYIYIEGYLVQNHELITSVVDQARAAGLKVCLDMASYNIVEADRDFFSELLDKTDIVFANEQEAYAFTGKEPREALAMLAARCETAVVKVGAEGAMAQRGDSFASVPAVPVRSVVDTTAAGDFFSAGFLYARGAGRDLSACLAAGAVLASEVIQIVGTRLDDATWQRLRALVG